MPLDNFEQWWAEHGQFCRAGGGDYEKTFAFRAWEAARAEQRERDAQICDDEAARMEQEAQRAIDNGEHDEVSSIRSAAWKLSVAANRIRAAEGRC